MTNLLAVLVEWSRRRAGLVCGLFLIVTLGGGFYASSRLAIDSDTGKLIDPTLPWEQAAADLDRQFPENRDLLVAVVDAPSPDQAEDAAAALVASLKRRPELFTHVRDPEANPFFRQEGLLFLPTADVQDLADHLISAQPFLGTLAADPSARGVLDAIDLLAQGVSHGAVDPATVDPALGVVTAAATAAANGQRAPLAWQQFLSGRKPGAGENRRFVLASAALNFGQVEAAAHAITAMRAAAAQAAHAIGPGVRIRVTGPVALNDEQLSALSHGVALTTALCLGLLTFWLFTGLRSPSAVAAVMVTLLVGLVACLDFAVAVIGPFNPVSVAFAPLFIGIAVDFGIQFATRYCAERLERGPAEAFRASAVGVGPPLALAATATAAGFLSFAPTTYLGVRDLGLIAGAGMLIALFLNLTLLPALLSVLGTGAQADAAGFKWGHAADRFLTRHRRGVLIGAALGAVLATAVLPRLQFDFNPVDLQSRGTEAVETLFDLMADPTSSPYSIEFLADPAAAQRAAAALDAKPEVARTLLLSKFVPPEQTPKLAILADAATLLGPTLSPPSPRAAPTDPELQSAITRCAGDLNAAAAKGDTAAGRLAQTLQAAAAQGPAARALLAANLGAGVAERLEDLRTALSAAPVALDAMPESIRADWVAPDGRWRVQVFPQFDTRSNAILRTFARTVRNLVPQAVGSAITVEEWTLLAPRAFATAGCCAVVVITILLVIVLRRISDVARVLATLLLAGLYTLGIAALGGFSINFANIITLPMMLGIGVAFNIYFVVRGRSGEPGVLGSPTARAVVFSALTTGTAFGSLALSPSPGMAEMGKFLSLGLGCILVCALGILPTLLPPLREGDTRS